MGIDYPQMTYFLAFALSILKSVLKSTNFDMTQSYINQDTY